MAVVLVGINNKVADLRSCEKLAIAERDYPKVLKELSFFSELQEVVVVSTCLRTEVYAVVDRFHSAVEKLSDWYAQRLGNTPELVIDYDDSAIRHLFEVACGINSLIPGEYEVLGQVRRALNASVKQNLAGPILKSVFQAAIKTGKIARTQTGISKGSTSIGHTAVELLVRNKVPMSNLLVIGTGELSRSIIKTATQLDTEIIVASSSTARAKAMGDFKVVKLKEIPEVIKSVDAVISATVSEGYVIEKNMLMKKSDSVAIVDLGMPRNVDPLVAELANVALYTLKDVEKFAYQNTMLRKQEIDKVINIIDLQLEELKKRKAESMVSPIIANLVTFSKTVEQDTLEGFKSELASLDPDTKELIHAIVKRAINKLLHKPITAVKESSGTSQQEQLIESLRILFELN